jgi:hypothetical protein
MKYTLLMLLFAGCTSDAPELHELSCSPSSLSASSPGPYTIGCVATFDGAAGDAYWTASGPGGIWTGGSGIVSDAQRDAGTFEFQLRKTEAPGVGALMITLSVDHVGGEDGPAGDSITAQVEVVP